MYCFELPWPERRKSTYFFVGTGDWAEALPARAESAALADSSMAGYFAEPPSRNACGVTPAIFFVSLSIE
jgi:hypothetical protein